MKYLKTFLLIVMVNLALTSYAQEENEKKCTDYPALTHLRYFSIFDCSKVYTEIEVPIGMEKNKKVEGNLYTYNYYLPADSNPSSNYLISWLQLHRNYENAIKKAGGKILYSNDVPYTDHIESFLLIKDKQEIYVLVEPDGGNEDGYTAYVVKVMEKQEMEQEVDASGIFEALNTEGHISLQINFETGKFAISPESQKIIDEIFQTLQNNPELMISIEGHTDNVGNPAANKTLSENRAKAVMDALIQKGISKTRLRSAGWGSAKPVADNKTEEGRAANRRVELIKR